MKTAKKSPAATRGRPTKRHDGTLIRPSRHGVIIYRALSQSGKKMSTAELAKMTGYSTSVVSHTLVTWLRGGLIKRGYLGNTAWWAWAPKSEAKALIAEMEESAEVYDEKPSAKVTAATAPSAATPVDPVAHALRTLARLLDAAAEKLEQR